MPQVIIVSNRLPVSVKKENGKLNFSPSVGGLATGLSSYIKDKSNTWIGWPGIASDELTEDDRDEIIHELAKHNCSPVFLTQKQIDDFYNGYSNTVLWPLLHKLRPQDRPGDRRDRWYRSYRAVNKLFAETVEVAAQKDAYIWVHDYQLLLLPEMLRDLNVSGTIGFFLHIPFPEPHKFTSLPDHRKILKGVLGADLIGFHTPDYAKNFLDTCADSKIGNVTDETIELNERTIRVSNFPMGIDYDKYASSGRSKIVKQAVKQYEREYKGKKVIVAVDRLDPSKGLLERLEAYGEFLDQYPDQRGKVIFVMVASPSRTDIPAYQRLAKRIDALVQKINEKYGTAGGWQPIDYINHTVPFEHVTALFQIADVAFIAPLRDGMNLAAKEFVASTHKNSVLILSETAGASQELRDALIVNPKRSETVVKALNDSLTMKRSELRGRLKRMKHHLKHHTVHTWAKDFVGTLSKPVPGSQALLPVPDLNHQQLEDEYKETHKRLILLDYDGTLVPFHTDPTQAKPSRELTKIINDISKNPSNDVVIISGRSANDLERWFGAASVNLVAEHGASIRKAGMKTWKVYEKSDTEWKKILLPILEKYAVRTPGAHVEVKAHSLVWHYRLSPPYYAHKHIVIIKRTLKKFLKTHGIHIQKGDKVLEFKNLSITKGSAATMWLSDHYDFVMAIGDDVTDEDMFKVIPGEGYSIKVGRGLTTAHYRVNDYKEVHKLLRRIARHK